MGSISFDIVVVDLICSSDFKVHIVLWELLWEWGVKFPPDSHPFHTLFDPTMGKTYKKYLRFFLLIILTARWTYF